MRRLAALLSFILASPAVVAGDSIEACRAAHPGDPAAHIRCLEDALRALAGSETARATPAAAAAATAADTRAAGDPPPAGPASAPTGLGAEQVFKERQQQQAAREPVAVRIVSASYNARGLGTFRMADGQVWRETTVSPERHRLQAATEYTGRIEPGRIVGYRLFVDGIKRMKTVERLE